jgi:hypothetical protein
VKEEYIVHVSHAWHARLGANRCQCGTWEHSLRLTRPGLGFGIRQLPKLCICDIGSAVGDKAKMYKPRVAGLRAGRGSAEGDLFLLQRFRGFRR